MAKSRESIQGKNARARGKTILQNIDKLVLPSTGVTKNTKQFARREAQLVKENIKKTYIGKNPTQKTLEESRKATNFLNSLGESTKILRGKNGLSNYSTQIRINAAARSKEDLSEIGEYITKGITGFSKAEIDAVYALTSQVTTYKEKTIDGRKYDVLRTEKNRNITLVRELGMDLQTVFENILATEEGKRAVEVFTIVNKLRNQERLTEEQKKIWEEMQRKDDTDGEKKYDASKLPIFKNVEELTKAVGSTEEN